MPKLATFIEPKCLSKTALPAIGAGASELAAAPVGGAPRRLPGEFRQKSVIESPMNNTSMSPFCATARLAACFALNPADRLGMIAELARGGAGAATAAALVPGDSATGWAYVFGRYNTVNAINVRMVFFICVQVAGHKI